MVKKHGTMAATRVQNKHAAEDAEVKRKVLKPSPLGDRANQLRRSPTRFERFRGCVEDLPELRLYSAILLIIWVALTALIILGARPPLEQTIEQGLLEGAELAQLEHLNLSPGWNPWKALLGVALMVAVQMGFVWYFIGRFGNHLFKTNVAIRVVLAASLMILFTALARAFIELDFNPYLIPLAGLSIIGTMLLGTHLMLPVVVITVVNVGIMTANSFLTAALLLVSVFAIYVVAGIDSRQGLLKAGLAIAAVMALLTSAAGLVAGSSLFATLLLGTVGFTNGLLSLMLATVLLPPLEDAFDIPTPMKLLELSDPGTPLMMKLLHKAPGTFTHSLQVGTLAEAAAERIGADALLARGGGHYHDIGKMEHPTYFIENQISGMNPHATLSPTHCAEIIKRHLEDGLELGRAWGLPQELLHIIASHHGSTRIEYFYHEALDEATSGEVNDSDFRYASDLPRSKEAGIVMIADSVEATVKALPRPTPEHIEDVVASTIKNRLDDRQFAECELTVREIFVVGGGYPGGHDRLPRPPHRISIVGGPGRSTAVSINLGLQHHRMRCPHSDQQEYPVETASDSSKSCKLAEAVCPKVGSALSEEDGTAPARPACVRS